MHITYSMISSLLEQVYTLIALHWLGYVLASGTLIYLLSQVLTTTNTVFSLNALGHDMLIRTCLIICLSSMAGLPPVLGFWTKLYLLILVGRFGNITLIIIISLIMLVGLIYYIVIARYTITEVPHGLELLTLNGNTCRELISLCCILLLGSIFLQDTYIFLYNIVL
uniref:NADH dehydrogenase subunit 2 n=1 Tax=Nyctotherus ovalis TaxID=70075 RepID=Q5DUY1_NYCOV|nr:NADH dehydrogenase subunit 2 [Nyctotherus ovalis]